MSMVVVPRNTCNKTFRLGLVTYPWVGLPGAFYVSPIIVYVNIPIIRNILCEMFVRLNDKVTPISHVFLSLCFFEVMSCRFPH